MRNTYKIFVLSALVSLGACKKDYLDINKDPNRILSATPVAVLPAAMTATAANVVNTYNSYGSWAVGYMAKSGQVNGYAPERTYNYTSNFYQGMWNSTYDNLNDYEFIIKQTAEDPNAKNLHAIANIMKAYNYQLLVDAYGDLPYTEALQGASVLTPKYDKAEDVDPDVA